MAAWLSRCGARLRVADSRPAVPGAPNWSALRLAPTVFSAPSMRPCSTAWMPWQSARVSTPHAARRSGTIARPGYHRRMELLALALRELGVRQQTRIIAITGTNGKTTTTALAGEMARPRACVPRWRVTSARRRWRCPDRSSDRGEPLPEAWVLELSSFQLETMYSLDPDAATVLNVSDDHLDRYADIAAYAATKARDLSGRGRDGAQPGDSRVAAMAIPGRRQRWFGTDAPSDPPRSTGSNSTPTANGWAARVRSHRAQRAGAGRRPTQCQCAGGAGLVPRHRAALGAATRALRAFRGSPIGSNRSPAVTTG